MQQKNNSSILWKSETSFRKLRKFRYIIELFDAKCDIIWVIVNYVENPGTGIEQKTRREELSNALLFIWNNLVKQCK